MTEKNNLLVLYQLAELTENYKAYTKGNRWAEPDVDEAAKQMRFVYENREVAARKGNFAARDIVAKFGAQPVGALVNTRLKEIEEGVKKKTAA